MSQNPGNEIYIGLMSGTSLDGVDVAVVDFAEHPPRLLHCGTYPYEDGLRQRLYSLCQSESAALDGLYGLDAELGELYANIVNEALEITSLDRSKVIAIGCHGQTIRHCPDAPTPYTVQIGDPNRLVTLTRVPVVADFRRKDIALGGQAAPLAPAFHRFLFSADDQNRALINIGGIANLTYLPRSSDEPVLGFDSGPGNTLLDSWNKQHQGSSFDRDGAWARSGQVLPELLDNMLNGDDYFRRQAPKSTGTEHFNSSWLQPFLNPDYAANDVQATLVELTATTIANALSTLPDQVNCFVCGGGARNQYLLERLAKLLPGSNVTTTADLGLDPDFVEAVAFAWLARERINLRDGNIPEVTRARHAAILGCVYAAD